MEHLRNGCALLAAAVTAVVLFGRWWATRNQAASTAPTARRGAPPVAGARSLAARAFAGLPPDGAGRTYASAARGSRVVHEAEAHLRQCWERMRPLYEPPGG
ncbi:hypothetical protein [Streptomyces sp. NPDC054887]